MDISKKKCIEKVAADALPVIEVAEGVLGLLEDRPWAMPAQLVLFTIKLLLMMYLEQLASPQEEPADPECHDTQDAPHTTPEQALPAEDDADEDPRE